jgi:hypothetical protein
VGRLAEVLISRRGSSLHPQTIGKNWTYRFITRHPLLKARLTQSKDSKRALQESPRVTRPWFDLVRETKMQYGIDDGDTYNFDETGFAIGVISGSKSSKVATLADSVGRATVM